jgi:pimeloyl-ACP methyl ester carboxylesterase
MTHLIIQIPGTWANGIVWRRKNYVPPWCRDTHPCRQSITTALGEKTLFRTFTWSGANGPEAQLRAAADLADYIREVRQQHPAARINVVAHSHGGNIAFSAARDPAVAVELSSIICLSTPFLHISPCDLGPELEPKLTMALSYTTITVLCLLCAWIWRDGALDLYQHLPASWPMLAKSWKPLAQLAIAAGLIFGTLTMAFNRIFEKAHLATYAYAKRFDLPRALPCPTLLIQTPGDEASGLLAAVRLVSGLLARLLRGLLAPCECPLINTCRDSLEQWKATASWLYACFAILGDWISHARGIPFTEALKYQPDRQLEIAAYEHLRAHFRRRAPTEALGMLLFQIGVPLVVVLIVLLGLLATPFGVRFAIAATAVHLSAESTPPGKWLLVQLDSGNNSLQDFRILRHQTHSDPAALQAIEDFLSQKFNAMRSVG